jgi:uncharacterized protein
MLNSIPKETLGNHIAILGKTGSGKTYAAKGMAERLLAAKERVCIIDPTGAWWGLRSNTTGKASGFPIMVFGGEHGDLPIERQHGQSIAEIIASTETSAVIDTRLMTVAERTQFFTDFAETLLRKNAGVRYLIIDEAHVFAPQGRVADPQSGKMLHAANNLVSLGRGRGLRITLISQRPAKLHKDSLTQVEALIALRLIAPQDRNAVEDWMLEWADPRLGAELLKSLPSLPTGEGWVWAPEIGILDRAKFPPILTYDSSRAPDGAISKVVLATIDLPAIEAKLKTVAADLGASDPKRLRARIGELEKQLKQKEPAAVDPGVMEKVRSDGYRDGVRAENHRLSQLIGKAVGTVRDAFLELQNETPATGKAPPPMPAYSIKTRRDFTPPPPRPVTRQRVAESNGSLGKGELAILSAVVQHGGAERRQLTVLTGYKRSSRDTYIQRLGAAGLVTTSGQKVFATESGLAAVDGLIEPLPEGRALLDHWLARLPEGERAVLSAIAEAGEIDRDAISDATGYKRSSRDTYLQRLSARQLIERPASGDRIRIAPELRG